MTAPLPIIADNARLAALYEVSQALSSSLKVEEVLNIVVDSAIELTRAERGFLMLFNEETGALDFRAARNIKQEDLDEQAFEVSRSVVKEAAQSGKPVVTTNAQRDPRFAGQKSVIHFALRSIMAAPLLIRGQAIGAIYVDNKAKDGLFQPPDLDLLTTFAAQAAVAIDNARLFTQTDQALAARVAELQTMQTIDRQLNAGLDFEKVMGVTLDWAVQRTKAERGWIGLVGDEEVRVVAGQGPAETLPLSHPLVAAALSATELRQSTDVEGTARLVASAVREGRAVAIIVVERDWQPFSAAAQDFLARLADHAAVAMENARLYAAVKTANDAKSKFVSIVSHELKLPMTSIRGYADLMRQGLAGPTTDHQTQFLDIIRTNVDRMAVLVSDLADISRIETGRLKLDLEAVDLNRIVPEALLSLTGQIDGKSQKLVLQLPPRLPAVTGDRNRLIQIISNLVSNAHKYSPAEGTITISAQVEDRRVRVSVQDTGVGISPEDQAKLFEQFFRSEDPAVREQSGWGLGLHVTKRLVDVLGGEISVHSDGAGRGSTFAFTVPVA